MKSYREAAKFWVAFFAKILVVIIIMDAIIRTFAI